MIPHIVEWRIYIHSISGFRFTPQRFPETAIRELKKFETHLPDRYYLKFYLGTATLATGAPEQALTYLQQALDLNPRLDLIRYRYVRGLVAVADWDTALRQVNLLLAKYPKHIDYNYLKGRILLDQGDYETARHYFEDCLRLKPDAIEIMMNLGICHYLAQQLEQAAAQFRKALVFSPADRSILMWLIETNIKAKHPAEVDRYVSRLIASAPEDQVIGYLENNFNDPYMPPGAKAIIIGKIKRRLGGQ